MFIPEAQVRAWLYNQPTDMRKSYDGLSALVKSKLEEEPLGGQLFVSSTGIVSSCDALIRYPVIH